MKFKTFRNVVANVVIFIVLSSIVGFSYFFGDGYSFTAASTKPIYCGENDDNEVSLMINVYWGTEYVVPILDLLDEYGFKTTFFIGGTWADKCGDVLKEIYDRGHEIGNHGYFHKDMAKISYEKNIEEIQNCDIMIETQIGVKPTLFAPPSGSFSKDTLKACENLNKPVIMWSKDTIDWRDKNSDIIFTRATKDLKSGDLILMHPTKETVIALRNILEYYKLNGYKVVTVSANISNKYN